MENQNSGSEAQKEPIQIIKDDEIDLVALAKVIWADRKYIFRIVLLSMVVGLMFAFFSPVKYRSTAVLLPQVEAKGNLGQLGSLAGLAGVNLSAMMGDVTGIQPELYPTIVRSFPFLNEMIHLPLNYEKASHPVSFFEKEMADSINGFGGKVLKYTIKLPWTIKDYFFGKKITIPFADDVQSGGIVLLDKQQAMLYTKFSNQLSVSVDRKTNLVSLSAESDESLVSAQIARNAVNALQKYIISYKTSLVRENQLFVEARFNEKKIEFEKAQRALLEYRDTYRNPVAERIDSRYQELQDAYTLSMSIYQNLAQQLEQARIAVKKETPVFTIIEPVKIPTERDKPQRSIIMIISIFAGVIIGVLFVFGKIVISKLKQSWN